MDEQKESVHYCTPYCYVPQRIILAIMGFFGVLWAFTNRISLSHAIAVLAISHNHSGSNTDVCNKDELKIGPELIVFAEKHDWSEQLQGCILGSFYVGYMVFALPGGVVADKYGAKWLLGIGILVSGVCTVLSPFFIQLGGPYALMFIRAIMGLFQGPMFPALTVLLAAWVPKNERATLGALCYSGATAGIIVSNTFSGLLLYKFDWPVTFFVFGGLSMIWFIFFAILCYNSPYQHPCIKRKEVEYLQRTIGKLKTQKPPIPWKRLLWSMPMMANTVGQLGHDWGYYVMITCLPKYMADVMQFSILANGFYTSMPYVAMWVSTILCGFIADWVVRSGKMSLTVQRKLATCIGGFLPGLFMVVASYAGCNKLMVVILFTFSMFVMGPYYAGQKLTAMDMSPSYAGTISAITNGLGSLMGVGAPSVVGFMTPNASLSEWRLVFWMAFAILSLSAIVFAIWAAGEIQPYDPMYQGGDKAKEVKPEMKEG